MLVCLSGLAPTACSASPTLDRSRLGALTFSETFAGPLDLFDPVAHPKGRWKTNYDFGWQQGVSSRTLDGEYEVYVDPAYDGLNPFSVGDGGLTVEARANPLPQDSRTPKPYVSGILTTSPSFQQRYGYFEIYAALPAVPGAWSAFWLAAPLDPAVKGPQHNGEIDVVEALGREPHDIFCSAHWPDGLTSSSHRTVRVARPDITGMHRYGVLWTATELVWYVDDQEVARMRNLGIDRPMNILIDLAVGGWDDNVPDPSHPTMRMRVGYVRAYALKD